ncbi:hypothetical protein KR026_011537, partial [Drosophila bipectinata]
QSKEAILKSYYTRLDDDVQGILENFQEILKLARRKTHTQIPKITPCEQDALEMQVRAANIGNLGRRIPDEADLKQYLIINDFRSIHEVITNNSQLFRATHSEWDEKLMKLRYEMTKDLYDLEEEYFTSIFY